MLPLLVFLLTLKEGVDLRKQREELWLRSTFCAIFSDKYVSEGDSLSNGTRVLYSLLRLQNAAGNESAKRGATCHHAGQLLRPGDGADAACLHNG